MTDNTQKIIALRNELRMLKGDLESISSGEAGSRFAAGDKGKLQTRIAAIQQIVDDLEATDSQET
ncbi:MAG: hypothetical protein EON93_08910 [Burkholderiales bacterium]|nr:MAG: hypothetical protein EON93_08910 [Burkholderiales bacterium]